WKGTGPYPSVTVRMDFRGPDLGDFVYHCHILEHEDKGMMQIIRVVAASAAAKSAGSNKATATTDPETKDSANPSQATQGSKTRDVTKADKPVLPPVNTLEEAWATANTGGMSLNAFAP